MLAYAANRPAVAKSQSSPNALLIVISAHVALAAIVASAKMDLPRHFVTDPPVKVVKFPPPAAPPPPTRTIDRTEVFAPPIPAPPLPLPPKAPEVSTTTETLPGNPGTALGDGGTVVLPSNPIRLAPVRHEPQLLTPFSELKPPYPASKLASEEEATLTLRLAIDENGRVVAVEPIGRADRVFVDAARRHLIAHWRYSPATEDGRAVASTKTITLRFQLDG
jgi:protein TonB